MIATFSWLLRKIKGNTNKGVMLFYKEDQVFRQDAENLRHLEIQNNLEYVLS